MGILGDKERKNPKTDVWLTPRWILDRLGDFDLDPCAAPDPKPWATAKRHFTLPVDGLSANWKGRVFMNPPFSRIHPWVEKMAEHGDGVAVIPGRIETGWMHDFVWNRASGVFVFRSRVNYCDLSGKVVSGVDFPTILVAYGSMNAACLALANFQGKMINLEYEKAPRLRSIK